MAIFLQITCFTFLLCMTYGRVSSSFFNKPFPSSDFDEPFDDDDDDDDWSSLSTVDEFDKMMATMDQQYKQMSAWSSSFFKAQNNDMAKIKMKLDAVTPVCTTTGNSSTTTATTILVQNNRRKQFRATQTTTCIKEMIINGTQYMYREITVTDDKGTIISQNNDYKSFTINQINNTTLSNITV